MTTLSKELVAQRGGLVVHEEHTREFESFMGLATETIPAHDCDDECDQYASTQGCCDLCPRKRILDTVNRALLRRFRIASFVVIY